MNAFESLSAALAEAAASAAAKVFHVPSPLGGRTALSFDGARLLVPAYEVEEGEALEILAPGGGAVSAKAVGFDRELGLAALELEKPLPGAAWVAAPGLPALGSLVLVAAYPSPQGPEVRLDTVRFAGGGGEPYIQTDGPPFPGFAGAAIAGADGSLVGFVVSDRGGNRGWALPASRAEALARSIADRGFPARAWLGISAIPIEPPDALSKRHAGRDRALIVAGLERGGPAEKAGVAVGDIIVSLGGAPVQDSEDLAAAIGKARPGEELAAVLLRAGVDVELSLRPEARDEAAEGRRGRGDRWRFWPRRRHGWGGRGDGWPCCGPAE